MMRRIVRRRSRLVSQNLYDSYDEGSDLDGDALRNLLRKKPRLGTAQSRPASITIREPREHEQQQTVAEEESEGEESEEEGGEGEDEEEEEDDEDEDKDDEDEEEDESGQDDEIEDNEEEEEDTLDDDHIEEEDAEPYNKPQVQDHQQQGGSDRVVVTLTDPELFDCPICCEPLTIPVYQCDQNGHIACSSCRLKIKNKCPSCSRSIGFNRCRAIEKALESITTSCQNTQYGCKEPVSYDKRKEHQNACVYSPCTCPHLDCNFVSSAKQLYQHFSTDQVNSAIQLEYYSNYSTTSTDTLIVDDKFIVLQEKKGGTLFVVANHSVKDIGNAVSVSCIQPRFMEGFRYEIVARSKGSSLRLTSVTSSTPSFRYGNSPPETGFLLIPYDFVRSSGHQKMDIRVWGK